MEVAQFVVGETCYFNRLFDECTGTSELGERLEAEGR